jgi:DNA-binding LytR/AlgR family response regulator
VRIAVCDDESIFREELRKSLVAFDDLPGDAVIAEFSDGVSLVSSHEEDPFDIIFLDIQMDGISGLEAGQKIRDVDRNAMIIYLTNHKQYVFQSLKVEIFDYLVKPVNDEAVSEVLSRALKKYRDQHHIIRFKCQDTFFALDVSEIVYVRYGRRHIEFVTKDKSYKCIGNLKEYEHLLSPHGFFRCHNSCLINMNYIKRIENDCIATTYNQKVDMSVRKKHDCLEAFNMFVTKHKKGV